MLHMFLVWYLFLLICHAIRVKVERQAGTRPSLSALTRVRSLLRRRARGKQHQSDQIFVYGWLRREVWLIPRGVLADGNVEFT